MIHHKGMNPKYQWKFCNPGRPTLRPADYLCSTPDFPNNGYGHGVVLCFANEEGAEKARQEANVTHCSQVVYEEVRPDGRKFLKRYLVRRIYPIPS